jgi:hypothetical protein
MRVRMGLRESAERAHCYKERMSPRAQAVADVAARRMEAL